MQTEIQEVETPTEIDLPKTLVVTEEDLDLAISKRNSPSWDPFTDCLVATTITNAGFTVKGCGLTSVTVNGKQFNDLNTGELVSDFISRRYDEIRAYLPFVIELK